MRQKTAALWVHREEAHGREEQARVLAETPGMTVETARRILAAAPQSAQARSDTALDRLMQGAPAPLAAGKPASAVNDLLNTPVGGMFMTSKETFTRYQPLGNSDPAHTATAPGGLVRSVCNDPADAGHRHP